MRLIDADALEYTPLQVCSKSGKPAGYMAVVMAKRIKEAPTVDAVPVARAEWAFKSVRSNFRRLPVWELMKCTACAGVVERYIGMLNYKYCPFCGAKMDAKED